MENSLLAWVVAAILLFWSVGAYNRLVRLRFEAKAAFGTLDGELARQVQLVQACLPADETAPQSQMEGGSAFWAGLQGAAAQLAASLAAARVKPLEADRIAALGAAQEVLATAWERAVRDDAHDLAGPRLPDNVATQREQMVRATEAATEQFNAAVARYNGAISQFPAILLAWLFGFQAARGLRIRTS